MAKARGKTVSAISSTDNAIAKFDGVNGQIQNSNVLLTDTGEIQAENGSESLPAYSFKSEPTSGMFVNGDEVGISSRGVQGFSARKTTSGTYTNIGIGGIPSVSDGFPLLVERNFSGVTSSQFTNSNATATSGAKFLFRAGTGGVSSGELALWHNDYVFVDAYNRGRYVMRSSESPVGGGISIVGGGPGDDIRMYAGGVAASNRIYQYNVDGSVQQMKEISTPVNPTTGHKLYFKSDGFLYSLSPLGVETPYANTITDAATKLKITRIASEVILANEVVRAFSATHCALATANTNADQATVLGIAENDAAIGETVDIVLLGVISDPIFSVFSLNDPLFLDDDGGITNIKRNSGYHVIIGDSLGGNDIMFRSEKPITIA